MCAGGGEYFVCFHYSIYKFKEYYINERILLKAWLKDFQYSNFVDLILHRVLEGTRDSSFDDNNSSTEKLAGKVISEGLRLDRQLWLFLRDPNTREHLNFIEQYFLKMHLVNMNKFIKYPPK